MSRVRAGVKVSSLDWLTSIDERIDKANELLERILERLEEPTAEGIPESLRYAFELERLYRFLAHLGFLQQTLICFDVNIPAGGSGSITCSLPTETYCIGTYIEFWSDDPENCKVAFYVDSKGSPSVPEHIITPNVAPLTERRMHRTYWVKRKYGYITYENLDSSAATKLKIRIDGQLVSSEFYKNHLHPLFNKLVDKLGLG